MILKELEYLYKKIPDFKITDNLYIKHPTYKEIKEFGEDKYIELILRILAEPDDHKSFLYDNYNTYWYDIDEVNWFTTQIKILSSSDIDFIFDCEHGLWNYQLCVNTKTGRELLYDRFLDEELTTNHIKLIKNHLNSMIGNSYKKHKEFPANDKTRDLLIETDRINDIHRKEYKEPISFKHVIENIMYNKFFDEDSKDVIESIKNLKNEDDIKYTSSVYNIGQLSVIKKIAEEIYKELQDE